jgi:nucleotide-binding universal stress UspA family protein
MIQHLDGNPPLRHATGDAGRLRPVQPAASISTLITGTWFTWHLNQVFLTLWNQEGVMKPFSNILIAYDGSVHSERALQKAIEVAQCAQAKLQILYAYDRIPHYLGEPNLQQWIDRSVEKAQSVIAPAVQQLNGSGLEFTTNILEGPAAEAIMRVAETEDCDLIVLGSRGLGMMQGFLLGSVSYRVLHDAQIPTLIIH